MITLTAAFPGMNVREQILRCQLISQNVSRKIFEQVLDSVLKGQAPKVDIFFNALKFFNNCVTIGNKRALFKEKRATVYAGSYMPVARFINTYNECYTGSGAFNTTVVPCGWR